MTTTQPTPRSSSPAPAWTPGPWNYDADDLGVWINCDSDPAPIAKMGKCTHFNTQANARLIAAAPEMAEALRRANIGLGYIYAYFRGQASKGLAEQFAGESLDEIRAILARLHGEGGAK